MGVSGNFLAVALPGLTKHSPILNIKIQSISEHVMSNKRKEMVRYTYITISVCKCDLKYLVLVSECTFSLKYLLSYITYIGISGFSFGTILENLLIENTQI